MKVSRHFLYIVSILLVAGGGAYYYFSQSTLFDRVKADNISSLDSYLLKNYSYTLNLQKRAEEAIRVYCDPVAATTTTQDVTIAFPCQNQNPTHKIIMGWAAIDKPYSAIMKELGNEQLFWRSNGSTKTEEGEIYCEERGDYLSYQSTVFGMDCTTTTAEGEKLYTSAFFMQPHNNKNITTFIVVMNTLKASSRTKVDHELLTLFSKQKEVTSMLELPKFSLKDKALTAEERKSASTSALFAQSEDKSASLSSNVITNNSGNGVDATVCDLVDFTSCYPLYCDSITAVYNYSLNKCIEPELVQATAVEGEKNCPSENPVWDGSKCRALTGNIISSNSCVIPVGKSSCSMEVFWSVQFPKGAVSIKRSLSKTESIILATNQNGNTVIDFPYQETPYVVGLFDGGEKLNEGKFSTVCARGGFDSLLGKCTDPQITKLTISGEYYTTPGILNFTCGDATSYLVQQGDSNQILATGTYLGEVHVPLIKSGNYSVVCGSGNYMSNPTVRYYNSPPPPQAVPRLIINPRTLSKGDKAVFVWDIDFPQGECKLRASVICKNDLCTTEQKDYEDQINFSLQTELTDEDDPETKRSIVEALTTVAPNHKDVDWKATGKKTLSILYTSDFTLSCGTVQDKKRVYVRGAND